MFKILYFCSLLILTGCSSSQANISPEGDLEVFGNSSSFSAEDIPVVAFSVGEEELSGFDAAPLVGHLAAWNYFQSVESDENDEFIEGWQRYIGDDERVTNDPMEATYIGFKMWAKAVEKAGTTDVDEVEQAMIGIAVPNLTGSIAVMNANHHLSKPVLIGEIQEDGQF